MFQLFHEFFPCLRRVRRNVVDALLRLLDAFWIEDLGGSDEIWLFFKLLVFNQTVGLDLGTVEDELSSELNEVKS